MLIPVTSEEKLLAVKKYLSGKETVTSLAERFYVHQSTVLKWIDRYEIYGENAFEVNQNKQYPESLKKQVAAEYLHGGITLRALAQKYKIVSYTLINFWIKKYNDHNSTNIQDTGEENVMAKGRETSFEERMEIVQYYLKNHCTYKELAEKFNIAYHQANSYVKKYREGGADALIDQRGHKKAYDEMTELEKLRTENKLLRAEKERAETELSFLKKLKEIERRWD